MFVRVTAANKRSLIGAVICAIAALLWTITNIRPIQLGWASRSWPNCPATVTKSTFIPGFGEISAVFEYSYTVAGRMYTGSDYDSFGPAQKKDIVKQFVNFQPGAGFPVYYSPQDPSVAFMTPGFQRRHIMTLAAGALLWIFAASFFGDATRRAKNPNVQTALV